jgi:hypothetical protein
MVSLLEFWNIGPTLPTSPFGLTVYNGNLYDSKLNWTTGDYTDGFGHSQLITESDGLSMEVYKQLWTVAAVAFITNDHTKFLHFLKACEYALSFRNDSLGYTGPVGSFPAQHKGDHSKNDRIHNKSMGMFAVVLGLLLAKQSVWYTGADKTTIDGLIVQLLQFTNWISDVSVPESNINKFFKSGAPANQMMTIAGYLQMAAQIHNNATLAAQARLRYQQIFDNNVQLVDRVIPFSPKGVFYEKLIKDGVGFDGSYMGFTMQNLAQAVILEPPGPQQDLYKSMLELGVKRWLLTVNLSTGQISATTLYLPSGNVNYNWTRVKETFPTNPNSDTPKGWDADSFPYRAQITNYVLGNTIVPDDLAHKMVMQGRTFGHINKDPLAEKKFYVMTQANIDAVKGTSATVGWAALIQAQRVGGGSFPAYPGGVCPSPVYILPQVVTNQSVHASHKTYLDALPLIDILSPGFPVAI